MEAPSSIPFKRPFNSNDTRTICDVKQEVRSSGKDSSSPRSQDISAVLPLSPESFMNLGNSDFTRAPWAFAALP